MAHDTCRHCGHQPVPPDTPVCPECGKYVPNPGPVMEQRNLILWIILVAIAVAGAWFVWSRLG